MGLRFDAPTININKNFSDADQHDYDGYAVTPTNAVVLSNGLTRGIFVTGTGNVAGTMADGVTTVLLTAVPANTLLPIGMTVIAATGTTATGIYALY